MLWKIFRKYPILDTYYRGIMGHLFQTFYPDSGLRVVERKWNNLIILDACRFDSFLKINWLDGKLRKAISRGSHTREWRDKNFQRDCSDIVYVSANPHFSEIKLKKDLGRNPFHHVEDVWDYGWNKDWGSVPPEKVNNAAVKISEKYPDKRLTIHYNQPHHPFPPSSKVSRSFLDSLSLKPRKWSFLCDLSVLLSEKFPGLSLHLKGRREEIENKERGPWLWGLVRDGYIDPSKVILSYEENLRRVLEGVEKLLGELGGKTVISADHGNMFGKYGIYGHPPRMRFKELVEIPWFEVESK